MRAGDYGQCLAALVQGEPTATDIARVLSPENEEEHGALVVLADRVRKDNVGDGVHLRALIEFSNHCRAACQYCGLRAKNGDLARYRMPPDEIIEAATIAAELGYRTVVLQSGEDAWYTAETIAQIVSEIKSRLDVAITLCVGERPERDYALWREAGADRYLLRIETSAPELYATLHPGMSFDNRVACLHTLRRLGYQLGSGVLIGLPGQSLETLARDLLFLRDLETDMVGMGPFIPHDATPLAGSETGRVELTIRMMAACRLLLPRAHIVATTALGTLAPLGREWGLQAGGNVAMPNVTPQRHRALYEIYPSKICINEEGSHCRGCIEARINSIGRHMATDYGHALSAEREPQPAGT